MRKKPPKCALNSNWQIKNLTESPENRPSAGSAGGAKCQLLPTTTYRPPIGPLAFGVLILELVLEVVRELWAITKSWRSHATGMGKLLQMQTLVGWLVTGNIRRFE